MQLASNFLARFKHIKAPDKTVRGVVVQAVEEVLEVTIRREDVTVSEGTLHLSVPSTVKAAVFQHKHAILTRVNNLLGAEQIKELR